MLGVRGTGGSGHGGKRGDSCKSQRGLISAEADSGGSCAAMSLAVCPVREDGQTWAGPGGLVGGLLG